MTTDATIRDLEIVFNCAKKYIDSFDLNNIADKAYVIKVNASLNNVRQLISETRATGDRLIELSNLPLDKSSNI